MPDTPLFTPAQIRDDGQNRVLKTAGQAGGLAAPVLVIAVAALHGSGWLHGDLGLELTVAYQAVLTTIFAALTNIGRLRGRA